VTCVMFRDADLLYRWAVMCDDCVMCDCVMCDCVRDSVMCDCAMRDSAMCDCVR
jgi:hypothetical protein